MSPDSMTALSARYAASYRRMKPTCTRRRPEAVSSAMIRRQASCVVANGFSQKTGVSAAMAASTYTSWVGPQEVTITASTSSDSMSSCPVPKTRALGSLSATALAASPLASETPVTIAPDSTSVIRRMWSWPIIPVPITPTFSVISLLVVFLGLVGAGSRRRSVRPATDRTEAAPDVVARGPSADGERYVGLDRVEVLLDHAVDLTLESRERGEQRRHVGLPVGRLAHNAELDRLGERHLLCQRAGPDVGVHRLQVHVGDPLTEALDDLEVVALAVGDVAGVQAQVDVRRIGVDERVEHVLHAVLVVEVASQLVGAGHQVLPLLGVDVDALGGLPGVHVGVLLGQVHEVLRADRGQQRSLPTEVCLRLLQRHPALVEAGEDRATDDGQPAPVQLVAELLRVLGHEALGAELGVDIPAPGDLVEVDVPGHLVGVAGKPHTPGIGSGAELQAGQVRHHCAVGKWKLASLTPWLCGHRAVTTFPRV